MINSSPQKIYNGLNFILHCNITLSMAIMTMLQSLKISVNLTGPANYSRMIPKVRLLHENSLQYNTSDTINSADSRRTGTYTCAAKVAVNSLSYLVTSSSKSVSTEITISMIICYIIGINIT